MIKYETIILINNLLKKTNKENCLNRKSLIKKTKLSDRVNRLAIQSLRQSGQLIITSKNGYYLADIKNQEDCEKIKKMCDYFRSYIIDFQKVITAFENKLYIRNFNELIGGLK